MEDYLMLGWALTFLVLALIAGVLGYSGLAGARPVMKTRLIAIGLPLLLVASAGCRDEGPAERAGRQVDEAAEAAREGAEGALERLGREVDEAAEESEEAAEELKRAAEEVRR